MYSNYESLLWQYDYTKMQAFMNEAFWIDVHMQMLDGKTLISE